MTSPFKHAPQIQKAIDRAIWPVGCAYVSTSLPRKCGIAEYTSGLIQAINIINPLRHGKIIALDNPTSKYFTYSRNVIARVSENETADYRKAAWFVNQSKDLDLVNIQHEFGIFGGSKETEPAGEKILEFAVRLRKPIVTTFHTVLPNPSVSQRSVTRELARLSTFVVVMLPIAAEMLSRVYGVTSKKIAVIPHGVPDFPLLSPEERKDQLGFKGKVLMSSIGLVGDAKGYEYAIQSLPLIKKEIPNILYLIAGESHPVELLKNGGLDPYREKLEALSKRLGVEDHVKFINRYLSVEEVVGFIEASDFTLYPSLEPRQVSSGVLARSIGAGRVCVATPSLYAREMLKAGRGIIVPFRNEKLIARAIIHLVKNPSQKENIERKIHKVGKTMTWVQSAHQYFHLFHHAVD